MDNLIPPTDTVTTPPVLDMTESMFRDALPKGYKKSVSKVVMANVMAAIADPDLYEDFRDNLLSYGAVLQEGKFRLASYVNAIKFVSLKSRGFNNPAAFKKLFPDRMLSFQQRRLTTKEIDNNVQAYARSTLVQRVTEQSLIPSWLLNQDLFQKALNTQAELMQSAKSEKVRSDAANSILTHLKRPEIAKIELDIGVKENSSIAELRAATLALAAAQRAEVQGGGVSMLEIAHSSIVRDIPND